MSIKIKIAIGFIAVVVFGMIAGCAAFSSICPFQLCHYDTGTGCRTHCHWSCPEDEQLGACPSP